MPPAQMWVWSLLAAIATALGQQITGDPRGARLVPAACFYRGAGRAGWPGSASVAGQGGLGGGRAEGGLAGLMRAGNGDDNRLSGEQAGGEGDAGGPGGAGGR